MDNGEKIEDMDTNSILFKIKQYEAEFEAIKVRMSCDYDKLCEIENKFNKACVIVNKRMKHE